MSMQKNITNTQLMSQNIRLNLDWPHERYYYDYIKNSNVTSALIFDLWVLSNIVSSNDCFVDVGANIGFVSILAKALGANDINCFEADPRVLESLKINCCDKEYTINPFGLGDKNTKAILNISDAHNQGSTLEAKIKNKFKDIFQNNEQVEIDLKRLDDVLADKKIDILKIDVEGFELNVLKGAIKNFANHVPRFVYIEIYEDLFKEIHKYLGQYYKYAYRVIANTDGNCRLFDATEALDKNNYEIMPSPPSYLYTNIQLDDRLINEWTKPNLQNSSQISIDKAAINHFKNIIKNLNYNLADKDKILNNHRNHSAALQKQVAELQYANSQLNQNLADKDNILNDHRNHSAALEKQVAELQSVNSQLNYNLADKDKILNNHRNHSAALQKQVAELQSVNSQLNQNLADIYLPEKKLTFLRVLKCLINKKYKNKFRKVL